MSSLNLTLTSQNLSDAKRQLLEKRLRGKTISANDTPKVFQLMENPVEKFAPYPLRTFQQALLQKAEVGDEPAWFYLEAEKEGLDAHLFAETFRNLVNFHPILQSRCVEVGGEVQLLTRTGFEWNPVIHDLRGVPAQDAEKCQQLIRDIFSKKHSNDDIAYPLILNICIIDNDRIRIHLGVDMLLLDLVSIEFLALQCRQLYEGRKTISQIGSLSFRDYVLTEKEFLASSVEARKSRDYWQEKLPSLNPMLAAADFPVVSTAPEERYGYSLALVPKERWRGLKHYASQKKLTGSMMVYSLFTLVLAKMAEKSSFSLELRLFRRLPFHSQVNDIMGQFSSGIVSSININTTQTLETYCSKIENQTWRDLDQSFIDLVGEKVCANDPGFSKPGIVFTSTISRYEEFVAEGAVPPMKWFGKTRTCVMQMPEQMLEMLIVENDGELECHWFYGRDYFEPTAIEKMQTMLHRLLIAAAENPEAWLENSIGDVLLLMDQGA